MKEIIKFAAGSFVGIFIIIVLNIAFYIGVLWAALLLLQKFNLI
jgi:hypothetical protein